MNDINLDFHTTVNSFLEGFSFVCIIFLIHLIISFHPYHRFFALFFSTSIIIILCMTLNYYLISPESNLLEIIKSSFSNSLTSFFSFAPLLLLFITILILKLSTRSRPSDPLLELLDSELNFE